MDTSQFKKMKRFRRAVRFIGAMFVLVGGILFVNFIGLLLNPNSTIVMNGVVTSDFGAKLNAVIFVSCFLVVGLVSLFGPRQFLNKLFIWRQSLMSVFFLRKRN